jgi:hypothetical protein
VLIPATTFRRGTGRAGQRAFSLRLFGDARNGSVGAVANLCSARSRRAKAEIDYIAQNGKVRQVAQAPEGQRMLAPPFTTADDATAPSASTPPPTTSTALAATRSRFRCFAARTANTISLTAPTPNAAQNPVSIKTREVRCS